MPPPCAADPPRRDRPRTLRRPPPSSSSLPPPSSPAASQLPSSRGPPPASTRAVAATLAPATGPPPTTTPSTSATLPTESGVAPAGSAGSAGLAAAPSGLCDTPSESIWMAPPLRVAAKAFPGTPPPSSSKKELRWSVAPPRSASSVSAVPQPVPPTHGRTEPGPPPSCSPVRSHVGRTSPLQHNKSNSSRAERTKRWFRSRPR